MANKTVGNGVGPVHSRNNVNHQNQFVPQAVLLRTGKVNIPPARPQPVPTGKPKVPAPVPTGRQNRPFPVPTDRGYSPSVTSGWWKSTARPMPHLNRPTSSYFQTYTPYVPQMYYNHMKYGGLRWATAVKPSAGCSWKTHRKGLYWENPYSDAEDEGIFDSGCSRSMTGNMERLDDFQEFQGGKVTFGGGEGRITGKGTIRTPTLDFENVYYVKELQQFNLFSISQICDKKNRVLFTDTDCLVLSKDFMLPDESMVVLRVPRKHNLYTINLNNLSPRGNLACLVAKASVDESVKWHRRMGHVNYKNMNRLVKGNLVRGLPPKLFKNDHTCVACCKGKQHKASYKAITAVSSISEPLQLLHMDLFGPTSIRSIDHKYYCLVITDDYSRFCWVFFLEHKDETYPILKDFINLVENQLNKKVKAIRCDNGTEFKNAHIIELCGSKGIKRDYSNARTPQQNGVAERKNRTLIEAARTMLADSKLPTMFWTEAVRTACYVLNRVLVTSPHNKTPYALLTGNIPSVSHFKPFGCHVTILNTSDHLGKFDGKADEGYIVGYSASNRAYRVYNVPNKRVEETMNLRYLEEKPNVQGLGHEWYFDLDYLTDSLGYQRVQANQSAGTQEASTNPAEAEPKDTSSDEGNNSPHDSAKEIFQWELTRLKGQVKRATSDVKDTEELQQKARTKPVPPGSIPVPTSSIKIHSGGTTISPGNVLVPIGGVPVPTGSPTDSFFDNEPTRFPSPSDLGNNEPSLSIFSSSSYDDEFGADLNNLASTVEVSPVATKRINTIHPQSLIIRDHTSAVQTRSKVNKTPTGEYAFISYIHDQQRNNHTDFQHCLFACFLSQIKPRTVAQALEDPSWVDGIVVKEQARLVAQRHRQEEALIYDEVFAPVTEGGTIDRDSLLNEAQKRYHPSMLVQTTSSLPTTSTFRSRKKIFKDLARANKDRNPQLVLTDWMVRSPELGPPAILATIDETPYTITEDLTRPEPDQPQDHLSTPPRQQATPPVAPVFEHGQRSDPNIASSSRVHETEDESLGGSFHVSPPRSTQAPPAGHTSGGAEDLITLTALSSVVSTLVQKVNSLETELKAHKWKLFKDGGVAKEGGEQAVDLDALITLANAAVTVDSNIHPGCDVLAPAHSTSTIQRSRTRGRMSASQRETRQVEVLSSAKHYSDTDWIYIMAQVHANAGLSSKASDADVK
ncbi:putative ribonuclease H-like domain-containing protein [Tanacetum coccineum]|uniref:Ribonuclease H-like domain-containing protein n=1 Tax=Tanacetum coccineum TaxID=301880 RepID=A0ABQ4XFB8_9ASTR